MSIKIGNISAKDIYIGSTPAKEVRLGSTLIWSRVPEEIIYYTINVSWEGDSGVQYVNILSKDSATGEWEDHYALIETSVTLPKNTEYYIVAYYITGSSHAEYGSADNPLVLTDDITFTIASDTPSEQYSLTVELAGVSTNSIEIKVGGEVVLYERDPITVEISHSGQEPIEINIVTLGAIASYNWSGNLQPQFESYSTFSWDSLPESGTLSVTISSS